MNALLVGGPLHGTVVPLQDKKAVTVTSEASGEKVTYIRRSSGSTMGSETALFVSGRPSYEEVEDAVNRSALSNSARLRILGAGP